MVFKLLTSSAFESSLRLMKAYFMFCFNITFGWCNVHVLLLKLLFTSITMTSKCTVLSLEQGRDFERCISNNNLLKYF